MNYSAVIFDLDGTVLDNEEVYAKAFLHILGKHGVDTSAYKNNDPQIHGIGMEENWERLKKEHNLLDGVSTNQLMHETQDAYHSMLDEVKIRPGFFELNQAVKEEGKMTALATSNDWWLVIDELEDLKIQQYFDTLVTGEEVAQKKPEPDIFLEAARKLGVEPEECVVIEDSAAGIEAAKEAGMIAIAIESLEERDLSKADLVVSGFEEITPILIETLFEKRTHATLENEELE